MSLPPFSKMKWLRLVFPPSPAPSAVMRTRLGSDSNGYGSSLYSPGSVVPRNGFNIQTLVCHLL